MSTWGKTSGSRLGGHGGAAVRWARSVPQARLAAWAERLVLAGHRGLHPRPRSTRMVLRGRVAPIVDRKLFGRAASLPPQRALRRGAVPALSDPLQGSALVPTSRTSCWSSSHTCSSCTCCGCSCGALASTRGSRLSRRRRSRSWGSAGTTSSRRSRRNSTSLLPPGSPRSSSSIRLGPGRGGSRRQRAAHGWRCRPSVGVPMVAIVWFVQLLRRGWRIALSDPRGAPGHLRSPGTPVPPPDSRRLAPSRCGPPSRSFPAFVWAGLTQPFSTTLELSGARDDRHRPTRPLGAADAPSRSPSHGRSCSPRRRGRLFVPRA